ncbi:unnamed protein product [Caenorhabditis auriculariae]|uniref:SAM domain-containing protein n=1 Tax=Caenorhabditis auriculariae TaxID=2777116 RepID=A0A8S1GX98_9PELO|nr:unnamed protein product [Caenorhabditis auriculariae]
MVEEEWRHKEDSQQYRRPTDSRSSPAQSVYLSHQKHSPQPKSFRHEPPRHSSVDRDPYHRYSYDPWNDPYFAAHAEMLRTRQFPEVAGIYGCDEQPALRRFTRYNQSIVARESSPSLMAPPPPATVFSKSSKKPSFFIMGNWTFRDRNKSRPSITDGLLREDRPVSMNLSDMRSSRSRSEAASRASPMTSSAHSPSLNEEFPRHSEFRIPVRVERSSMAKRSPRSPAPAVEPDFRTNIAVDDVAILRPKKEIEPNNNNVNHRFSFQSCVQMRKSCPDLDTTSVASIANLEQHRVSKKRNRRAKEKMSHAAWRRKRVQDWSLDDVLLWLQSCQLDEVASLLIGYDLRGEDLLQWNHQTLVQLGVGDEAIRVKILDELAAILKTGPVEEEEKRNPHKTLFDIVRLTSYDQVLAVETPLTTRDITVTHGRLGCLQITKVNGVNLPLREQDCLLEINERPGEQFKSALMLTKLISDSNGTPIRFVVLRRKTEETLDDSINERSSSGISSSPQTPTE